MDWQLKDDENLVISGMNDGQYIPETESEMDSDQGHSSDDGVVFIRSRSSLALRETAPSHAGPSNDTSKTTESLV